jgi:hypothetical protein
MPLEKGKSREVVSSNIEELHKGPQHAKTEAAHGKKTADAQAVAIALKEAGLSKNIKTTNVNEPDEHDLIHFR